MKIKRIFIPLTFLCFYSFAQHTPSCNNVYPGPFTMEAASENYQYCYAIDNTSNKNVTAWLEINADLSSDKPACIGHKSTINAGQGIMSGIIVSKTNKFLFGYKVVPNATMYVESEGKKYSTSYIQSSEACTSFLFDGHKLVSTLS